MSGLNDRDKARKWFEETRKLHLGTPNPDLHKVMAGYRKSLELQPGDANVIYHLGLAQLGHREWTNAEEQFRSAIRIKPDMAEAWFHLGQVLLQQRRPDEGEVAFRKAIDLTPKEKRAPLYFANASSLTAQHDQLRATDAQAADKKLREAEECYRLGVEIKPDDPTGQFQFALFLQNVSQLPGREAALDEAEQLLDGLLEKLPTHRDILNLRALVYSRRGALDDAVASLEKALEQQPDDAGLLFNLGQMLEQAGRTEEARGRLERSLELQPRQPGALSRLAGIVAQHDKDLDKALELVEKGLEMSAEDSLLLYQKALIRADQSKAAAGEAAEALHAEAKALVERVLERQPQFQPAQGLYARLTGQATEPGQAVADQPDLEQLKQELEASPDDEQLQRKLLDASLRGRKFDEALPLLEKLLKAHPEDPALRVNHGLVLSWLAGKDMNKVRQARESLRQGLKTLENPDSTTLLRLVQLNIMLREPEEATDLLKDLLERAGEDKRLDPAQLWQLMGVSLQQKAFFDEAEAAFRSSLELLKQRVTSAPGNTVLEAALREGAGSLAHSLEIQGKQEEAIEAYREWHKLAPSDANPLFRMANLQNRSKQHAEALESLKLLEQLDTDNPVTHFYLGLTLIDLERSEEAESCLMKALELKPDFPEAQQRLQFLQQNRPLVAASIDELRKSVEEDPEDLDDRLLLGQACLAKKDWAGAVEQLEYVTQHDDQNHKALFDLSNAFVAQSNLDKAIDCLIQLEERLPADPGIRFRLAELLLENGEEELAVKEYRHAVEMQPNNAAFQFRYGVALKEADKEDKAEEAIRRALDLQKVFPLAHFELGLLEYTSERHDAALKNFALAFQQDSRSYMALYYSGMIHYSAKSNHTEAAKFFQSALSVAPEHGDSHFQLARLFKEQGRTADALRHLERALTAWPEDAFNRSTAEEMLAALKA